ATIAAASGITGLTLPGMIDDPGCSAGREISARPASGPEFIHRRSLAIFISATAAVLSWPESATAGSWEERLAKKFGAGTKASPVSADSARQKAAGKRGSALTP